MCIIWVSGEVSRIYDIVDYNGGYLIPVVGSSIPRYTAMFSTPCNNTNGDTIVTLHDEGGDILMSDYKLEVQSALAKWGVHHV